MPDDDILRATTSVDTAGLSSGMQQAASIVSSSLQQIKAEYKSATDQLKAATANLASAQEQLGAAAKAGNQTAIDIISEYQAACAKASSAVKTLESALNSESSAANAAARATQNLGSAHSAMVPQVAAASAAIRVFEGNLPIRAVERFLTTIPGVGAALQAAFPIFGAVALAEVVGRLGKEVIELARAWDLDYQAQQRAMEEGIKLAKDFHSEVDSMQRLIYEEAERVHGKAFSLSVQVEDKKLDIKESLREAQEAQAQGRLATSPQQAQMYADKKENKDKEVERQLLELNKLTAEQHKAQLEEEHQHAQKLAEAYRERETALRKADQDRLTDLEIADTKAGVMGVAHLEKVRSLLAQEIGAQSGFTDLYRELRRDQARVDQQIASEQARNAERAQKSAEEFARKRTEALKREFDEQLRDAERAFKEQEDREKQNRQLILQGREAAIDAQEHAVRMGQGQSALSQAQHPTAGGALQSLNPFHNSELDDLKQQQQAENALLQLEIQRSRLKVDTETDPVKKLELERQLQQQLDKLEEKKVTDAKARAQQISQFEQQMNNTITQGFTNAVNRWIETGRGFGTAMKQMGVSLVEDFADTMIKMEVHDAEMWLLRKLNALAFFAAQQTMQATDSATQISDAATTAGTVAAINSTANVAAVESQSAVAGATVFAENVDLGIPVALAMGAEAYATDFATFGPLAAYEQGGLVPSMGLAMLHPQEMVLPAPVAQTVLNAVGGNSSKSSSFHATLNQNVNGITDAGFRQMLDRNGDHLIRSFAKAARRTNMF